jgi:hypothetical protein
LALFNGDIGFTGGVQTKRQRLEILRAQLENERSSFISHWQEIARMVLPRRPRFFVTDVNRGDRRNQNIIDTTPTLAVRTLQAGMQSGITNPNRDWFRLGVPSRELMEDYEVKTWLELVTKELRSVFLKSNFYTATNKMYGTVGTFGTAGIFMEEDRDSVVHFHNLPLGSFSLAVNSKGQVDTMMREFMMTVRQIVDTFGRDPVTNKVEWKNISRHVKDLWEAGHSEAWIQVVHAVLPNEDFNPRKLEAKYKRYSSIYYEVGTQVNRQGNYLQSSWDDIFLRESGFDIFPVLAPRWEVTGEDVYGTDCPGMTALGDIRQLQAQERRLGQAIEKMVNPPMTGSSALKNVHASILPGDLTYDDTQGANVFRPAHTVDPRILELEQKQAQIRARIEEAFFKNLFLMIASSDRRQITAREIDERSQEKLIALGPVLSQLDQDYLDPVITNTFYYAEKQGRIPPAPEALQGAELKIEYISMAAQAQKLVGLGTLERFTGYVAAMQPINPSIMDKVDMDQMVDEVAEILSVPVSVVRPDEAVAEIRSQRQEAMQMQQAAEAARPLAQAAKDMSQAKVNDEQLVRDLVGA